MVHQRYSEEYLRFLDHSFVAYDTAMVVDVLAFLFLLHCGFTFYVPYISCLSVTTYDLYSLISVQKRTFFRNSEKTLILKLLKDQSFLERSQIKTKF